MSTAYISHPDCHAHDTGQEHPECASRLSAIEDNLLQSGLSDFLINVDAPEVTEEQLLRAHTAAHIASMKASIPFQGYARLDPDTVICPQSLQAAKRAAGAAVHAVDMIMDGRVQNAFCAVRPPGHHAETDRALGF